jgi:FkbM family methyltransferase
MTNLYQRIKGMLSRVVLRSVLHVQDCTGLEKLGSEYGGWVVPTDQLDSDSICYCAGVGEDVSFDLELISRFSCSVFAFDPTPRAKAYVEGAVGDNPKYHFYDVGLWSSDTRVKFYAPRNPAHVSHSILNLQRTSTYFEADCKKVSTLARELGHDHIDVLKMDIEGAEFEVLNSLIADDLNVKVLCVEFNQPIPVITVLKMVRKLERWNYSTVAIDGWNFTFIQRNRGG